MNSYQQGRRQRHGRGRSRRRGGRGRLQEQRAPAPKQKTFWQRIVAFFGNGGDTRKPAAQSSPNGQQQQHQRSQEQSRPARKPESVEVPRPQARGQWREIERTLARLIAASDFSRETWR